MKKFHFKKSVSQEEAPTLLRLERRHTLMNVMEEDCSPDSQKLPVRSPTPECMELNKLKKLSQSSTDGYGMKRRIPAKSLSYDAKSSQSSPASSVVITDSDLSSSWIYKSKKEAAAACNDVFESSPCDPKSPLLEPNYEFEKCKQRTPRTPRTPKTRIVPKKSVIVPTAKRPQTCSSCCCIFTVLLLVFLCSIGIMSAIGGIVYLELYARIRPMQQVSLTSHFETVSHGENKEIPASVENKQSNLIIHNPANPNPSEDLSNNKSSITESNDFQKFQVDKLNAEEITSGSGNSLNKNIQSKSGRRGRVLDDADDNDKVLTKENDKQNIESELNPLEFIVERQLSHLNISLEDLTVNSADHKVPFVKGVKSVNEESNKISQIESKDIDLGLTKHQIPQDLFLDNQQSKDTLIDSKDGQALRETKQSPDTSKIILNFNSAERDSSPNTLTVNSGSQSLDSRLVYHLDSDSISLPNTINNPDANSVSNPESTAEIYNLDTNSVSNPESTAEIYNLGTNSVSNPESTAEISNIAKELATNADKSIAPNSDSNAIVSSVDSGKVMSDADHNELHTSPDSSSLTIDSISLAPDSSALAPNLDSRSTAPNPDIDVINIHHDSNAKEADPNSGEINDSIEFVRTPNKDSNDIASNSDKSYVTPDSSEIASNGLIIQSSNQDESKIIGQLLPTLDSSKLNVGEETIETSTMDIAEPIVITSVAPTIPFEFFRRLEMEELPEAMVKSRGIIDMQASLADAVQKMQHLKPSNRYPSSRKKVNSPQRPSIAFTGQDANLERLFYKQRLRAMMYDNV